MKRKKEHSRATHVAGDSRKRRLHQLFKVCAVLLLPTLYLFYSLSGLYLVDVEISKLKEQIIWCLLHPLKVYNDKSLSMVLVGGLLWMICSFQAYNKSDHNRMPGNEFGSAKWGEVRAFNEKYAARTEETKSGLSPENKVLSQNVRFRYDSDTLRNNNIVVVGGSGAGKTAFFLTPNLMSLHDCNIYTDPKGSLVEELGAWLAKQKDTRVYTLNLCEMEKSMHFNPFPYIRSKSDITKLVTNLIRNTNSANIKNSSADPFWERAERMFLESLFLYVWMECPKGVYNPKRGKAELLQRNWESILYLLDEAQFMDEDTPPKLDERMKELAKKQPDHPAVKAYQRYRGGPDETIRSVIMTVNARMQPFDNEELLEIFYPMTSRWMSLEREWTETGKQRETFLSSFRMMTIPLTLYRGWCIRCFFRSCTVRRDSLAESCRWMSVSGWMKWQISRCRITLIRSLPLAEAMVCTVCQSYSLWHS